MMHNKITAADAAKLVERYEEGYVAVTVMATPSKYIVYAEPESKTDSRIMLDTYYSVSASGKVDRYSPVMNTSEFNAALRNILLKK